MVPTRHFSTVCRRTICATRSGASVMTAPQRQAVPHEAQAQRWRLWGAAASAPPKGTPSKVGGALTTVVAGSSLQVLWGVYAASGAATSGAGEP